eukprot:279461_1
MSTSLLRQHLKEYHNCRFKNKKSSNPRLRDLDGERNQNAPQQKRKKITGKKMKRKLNQERKKIISYQHNVASNVQHNVAILKRLAIQTNHNVPQWQARVDMIKNTAHSLG